MEEEFKSISIEFTGIAGVGKSTLVNKLLWNLDKEGIPYKDLTIYSRKKLTLRNILIFLKSLYITFIVKPTSIFGAIKIFKVLSIKQMLQREADPKNTVNVYDEGLFHCARSLRRYSRKPTNINTIKNFSRILSVPDILVILKAEPEIIYHRRKKRNRKNDVFNFKTIYKEVQDRDFDAALLALERDGKILGKNIKIIELNNNKDHKLQDHINQIIVTIKQYLE